MRGIRDSIAHKESECSQLKKDSKSSTDRVKRFGSKLPAILADIANERFRRPVIGPIGMHVSLSGRLNAKQSCTVIERVAGNMLRNFLVSEGEDRSILERILRKHNAFNEHRILEQRSAPKYRVEPIPDATSVLDLMVIDEDKPDVFNILVDMCNIDRIIVAENEGEVTRKYVARNNYGRNDFKPGIMRAITLEEDTSITFRNGNRGSEVNMQQCHFLLATDSTESVRDLEASIDVETKLWEQEREALADSQKRRALADKGVIDCNTKLQRLAQELSRLQKIKREQDLRLRDAQQENDVDTTALTAELEDLVSARNEQQIRLDEQNGVLAECKDTEKEMKQKKSNADRKKAVWINRIREQESAVEKFLEEKELIAKDIRLQEKALENSENALKAAQVTLAKVEDSKEKAEVEARAQTRLLIENWNGERLRVGDRETADVLRRQVLYHYFHISTSVFHPAYLLF